MLTRWNGWAAPWLGDPFEDLGELRRQMSQMSRVLEDYDRTPRFELNDAGDSLRVRAEMPGFRQEDVDVRIERRTLTIRARREIEQPEGYVVHHRERGAMEIARAFTLPYRVDPEKTSATLKNGVLELTLAKAPEEQPRRVDVKVS